MRSIILAVSNPDFGARISQILIRAGLPIRSVLYGGASILRQAALMEDGGVIVFHPDFPDMSITELHSLLPESFDYLVLGNSRRETEIARLDGVTVLDLPVPGSILSEAAANLLEHRTTAIGRRSYGNKASAQKAKIRRLLSEESILIEAKKRLMLEQHMTEDQAHRYLQHQSMTTGIRIIEIAKKMIESDQSAG
jgi:response regulator NasT